MNEVCVEIEIDETNDSIFAKTKNLMLKKELIKTNDLAVMKKLTEIINVLAIVKTLNAIMNALTFVKKLIEMINVLIKRI